MKPTFKMELYLDGEEESIWTRDRRGKGQGNLVSCLPRHQPRFIWATSTVLFLESTLEKSVA